jgi:type I restriction enzyme, S subunit
VRQINIRKYVTEKGISESATNKVPAKTLLVVTRVGLGKIAIAESSICFSQDLQGLIQNPELICPEYTLYLLSYELQVLKYKGRGTTISGVTKKQLKDLGFPLPPLNEQRRIVAKIEELFSELDKGIESLQAAAKQLKVYREALLKCAFEGRLTAKWREENRDKLKTPAELLRRIQTKRAQRYQELLAAWQEAVESWAMNGENGTKPSKPGQLKQLSQITPADFAKLTELPEWWTWIKLGNTNVEVFDGPFGSKLKSSDYVNEGVRVIRLENIGTLEFIEEKKSYVSQSKYESLRSHTVSSGDIIFASFITEGIRVVLLPPSVVKAINKADCFCIRLFGESLNKRFVEQFLSTRYVYKSLEALIHGVGRPRVNTTQLKNVLIPLCGPAEQAEIIKSIENKLSTAENLERQIESAPQQSEALRQAILKKAFSGRLVPHDRNDEPASVLLERIRSEKAREVKSARRQITNIKPKIFS